VWEQWSGIDYVDAAAAAAAAARTDSAACGRADDGNSCLGSDDRGRAAGGTTGITALLADRRFPFEPTSRRIVTDEALLGVYDQRAAAGPGSSSRSGGGGGGGGELVGARMSAWFYTDDADNSGSGSTCCYTFSLSTRAGAAAAEVRKRPFFHCCTKNDHFTKTGSGQTSIGKARLIKSSPFFLAALDWGRCKPHEPAGLHRRRCCCFQQRVPAPLNLSVKTAETLAIRVS
jgi:hypothetical protein